MPCQLPKNAQTSTKTAPFEQRGDPTYRSADQGARSGSIQECPPAIDQPAIAPVHFGDRKNDQFLDGPIPVAWLQQAAMLPGRSLHVAILIWCAASIYRTRTVSVSNITALGFGIDRNAKYRALRWLEEAHLIEVDRRLGISPVVTIAESGDQQ